MMKNLHKVTQYMPNEAIEKLEAAVKLYQQQASISFKALSVKVQPIVGADELSKEATIRVVQERNARGQYLTAAELRERAKKLFTELLPGWKIHTRPLVYTPSPAEAVTTEWVEEQIKKHQINQKILAEQLGVSYPSLNKILTSYNDRRLTEFQKAAFYYYFQSLKKH